MQGIGTLVRLLDAYASNTYLTPPDDPEMYDGAPVGVQIVGRKYEEEKIWAVGKIIYSALKRQSAKTP